ncbi:tetratricopeptide repeat protein [Ectothiorhodospira mobilis]|uniref:tetratricopeptide repeat protein n=1 Tax=Ectothiorhodospira mobilis TaxID=195064 RepID=UPI001EE7CB92|nr:tetratricopeptide repeat protein [Ectothiorhodospira mobilis]MCG5534665.1 tetratricopeptide repeat protein [Ectothiorhodospira mobilis]
MSAVLLPKVEELREDLLKELPIGRFWQVRGNHFAGKSTLLRYLANAISEEKRYVPVLLQPPERAPDAGMAALLDVAEALAKAGCLGREDLEQLQAADLRWEEKLDALSRWLEAWADDVVLLCDDPERWYYQAGEDSDHFRQRTQEVLDRLMTAPCRVVVTGNLHPTWGRSGRRWFLDTASAPEAWLRDAAAWGDSLGEIAAGLADQRLCDLAGRSALEVRLLVALAAVQSPAAVARWWGRGRGRRELTERLITALEGEAEARPLLQAWGQLSLVRRPLDESMLTELEVPGHDELWGQLLRRCLLFQEQGQYRLHELLKADARARGRWLEDGAAVRAVHARLHGMYRDRFQARGPDDGRALVEECEAFHHGMHSGDYSLMDQARPFFATQLNILGRALSRDQEDYARAAQVFERVLQWEPEDAYAHHYRAYNLDILARQPRVVEAHYQRAIHLEPDNIWWRSRWINYLITRGRMSAVRHAWIEVLDQFELPDPDADPAIYRNLHIWVARLLLHRGQLDMAEEVLQGIPEGEFRNDPGMAALKRHLAALLQARRGEAVFPLSIPVERQWECPHLLPPYHGGKALFRWMPARVDGASEKGVALQAAEPPAQEGAAPRMGILEIPATLFNDWCEDISVSQIEAGRFLEMGWYEEEEHPLIRIYPSEGWCDPDLPPLFPDPARYLREAGWTA